jgi:hypothetical protein
LDLEGVLDDGDPRPPGGAPGQDPPQGGVLGAIIDHFLPQKVVEVTPLIWGSVLFSLENFPGPYARSKLAANSVLGSLAQTDMGGLRFFAPVFWGSPRTRFRGGPPGTPLGPPREGSRRGSPKIGPPGRGLEVAAWGKILRSHLAPHVRGNFFLPHTQPRTYAHVRRDMSALSRAMSLPALHLTAPRPHLTTPCATVHTGDSSPSGHARSCCAKGLSLEALLRGNC